MFYNQYLQHTEHLHTIVLKQTEILIYIDIKI